jgi:hypothetical protein
MRRSIYSPLDFLKVVMVNNAITIMRRKFVYKKLIEKDNVAIIQSTVAMDV